MFERDICLARRARSVLLLPLLTILIAWPSGAQTTRVSHLFALPTLAPAQANQTSLPKYLGYFEQEGLQVEHALVGSGGVSAAAQLIASGQKDIGSGTQLPVLARAAEGQDLGLTFFYNQLRDFHYAIGVVPGSPITQIADLKGKSIGVAVLGSEGTMITRYFAREAGLDPDKDINFVAIGVGAQAAYALRTGRVDAICTTRAIFAQMETIDQRYRYLKPPASTQYVFGPGLFVRRDYLQKNRRTVVGLGRAVAKGTLFALTNPEATVRIHWKVYPDQRPQGVAEDIALRDAVSIVKVQNGGLQFADDEPVKLFGHYPASAWNNFLKVFGLSGKITDVDRFYTNDLIAEINDFDRDAVTAQARDFRLP